MNENEKKNLNLPFSFNWWSYNNSFRIFHFGAFPFNWKQTFIKLHSIKEMTSIKWDTKKIYIKQTMVCIEQQKKITRQHTNSAMHWAFKPPSNFVSRTVNVSICMSLSVSRAKINNVFRSKNYDWQSHINIAKCFSILLLYPCPFRFLRMQFIPEMFAHAASYIYFSSSMFLFISCILSSFVILFCLWRIPYTLHAHSHSHQNDNCKCMCHFE